MRNSFNSRLVLILLIGDSLVLAAMTAAGFVQHNTLNSGVSRMLVTYLSTFIAWMLVAPVIRAFDSQVVFNPKELWRPLWAAAVSMPLAAFLRGLWLDTPIMPIFIFVFGGSNGLAILAWRALFLMVNNGLRRIHG